MRVYVHMPLCIRARARWVSAAALSPELIQAFEQQAAKRRIAKRVRDAAATEQILQQPEGEKSDGSPKVGTESYIIVGCSKRLGTERGCIVQCHLYLNSKAGGGRSEAWLHIYGRH